jgi:hypothetical protein
VNPVPKLEEEEEEETINTQKDKNCIYNLFIIIKL